MSDAGISTLFCELLLLAVYLFLIRSTRVFLDLSTTVPPTESAKLTEVVFCSLARQTLDPAGRIDRGVIRHRRSSIAISNFMHCSSAIDSTAVSGANGVIGVDAVVLLVLWRNSSVTYHNRSYGLVNSVAAIFIYEQLANLSCLMVGLFVGDARPSTSSSPDN